MALEIFFRDTCQLHDRPLQANLEILVPVYGNSDPQVAPRPDEDMVTAGDTSQTPALFFKNLAHPLAAYDLHIRRQSP